MSAPLSQSDWTPRSANIPTAVRVGMVGGSGGLVLLTGVILGGRHAGSSGAGIGAGVGVLAGFLIGGLVSSLIEEIDRDGRTGLNRTALAVGAATGAITLLIVGVVLGDRLAGDIGAATGAIAGLALGLLGAGLTGFIAEAISDVVTLGRGPLRFFGILAGGLIGGLVGLTVGSRYGDVGLITGFLLGLAISALGLELISIVRPQRRAHPRRVRQPPPARRPARSRLEPELPPRAPRPIRVTAVTQVPRPTRAAPGPARLRPDGPQQAQPDPIRPILPPYRRTGRPLSPAPYRRTGGPTMPGGSRPNPPPDRRPNPPPDRRPVRGD